MFTLDLNLPDWSKTQCARNWQHIQYFPWSKVTAIYSIYSRSILCPIKCPKSELAAEACHVDGNWQHGFVFSLICRVPAYNWLVSLYVSSFFLIWPLSCIFFHCGPEQGWYHCCQCRQTASPYQGHMHRCRFEPDPALPCLRAHSQYELASCTYLYWKIKLDKTVMPCPLA